MNIKKICIALIMAFLACSLGAWVRPGPEPAGLSFADQLGLIHGSTLQWRSAQCLFRRT